MEVQLYINKKWIGHVERELITLQEYMSSSSVFVLLDL